MNTPIRQISLREFQRNASDYIKKLPITLTQYGGPVCVVFPIGTSQMENVSTENIQNVEKTQNVSTHEAISPINKVKCNFCPNMGATRHSYQFEDGSGDAEAEFCPACWNKYENHHKSMSHASKVFTGQIVARPTEFRGSFPKPVKKKK